jgi:ribulose bisphosphate carboxylase small subunit
MTIPHSTKCQYINSTHYITSRKFQYALRYVITAPVLTTLRHNSDGKHYNTSWHYWSTFHYFFSDTHNVGQTVYVIEDLAHFHLVESHNAQKYESYKTDA